MEPALGPALGDAGPDQRPWDGRPRLIEQRQLAAQLNYLRAGLDQPGGKLPLFDQAGAAIPGALIRACIAKGWAERWFHNPMAPDWLVCRLTPRGAKAARDAAAQRRQSTSRRTGALPT